jgi:hypothetical protein
MIHTVKGVKRGVPIEVDYDDEGRDYPEMRAIYVGDVKVWPLNDAANFILWVCAAADKLMQDDVEESIQRGQDEQADRKESA